MCVYFDATARGRGVGELVLVLFVCASLNFCRTNLGYCIESTAPLGFSLFLNLEDSCLWRQDKWETADQIAGRALLVLSACKLNYKPLLDCRRQFNWEVLPNFSHNLHHSCRVLFKLLADRKLPSLLGSTKSLIGKLVISLPPDPFIVLMPFGF